MFSSSDNNEMVTRVYARNDAHTLPVTATWLGLLPIFHSAICIPLSKDMTKDKEG